MPTASDPRPPKRPAPRPQDPAAKATHEAALMAKAALWGARFAVEVYETGGDPAAVLSQFTDQSVATMVLNGLAVTRR